MRPAFALVNVALCSLLVSTLVPARALAQTPARQAPVDDPARQVQGDCARARAAGRTCELTIEAEEVGGHAIRPDGDGGSARIFEALGSLFHPRRDFLREIVASAQDAP